MWIIIFFFWPAVIYIFSVKYSITILGYAYLPMTLWLVCDSQCNRSGRRGWFWITLSEDNIRAMWPMTSAFLRDVQIKAYIILWLPEERYVYNVDKCTKACRSSILATKSLLKCGEKSCSVGHNGSNKYEHKYTKIMLWEDASTQHYNIHIYSRLQLNILWEFSHMFMIYLLKKAIGIVEFCLVHNSMRYPSSVHQWYVSL